MRCSYIFTENMFVLDHVVSCFARFSRVDVDLYPLPHPAEEVEEIRNFDVENSLEVAQSAKERYGKVFVYCLQTPDSLAWNMLRPFIVHFVSKIVLFLYSHVPRCIEFALLAHPPLQFSLVVRGVTLQKIFENPDLYKKFQLASTKAVAVVCCRTDPAQKARVRWLCARLGG